MDTGTLVVSPEVLRQTAKDFKTESENVNDVITRMNSLLQELVNQWKGNTSLEFAAKFDDLRPSFEDARDLIADISETLVKVADYFEEADNGVHFG